MLAKGAEPARALNFDFWLFWAGQTISNLGSSFTAFALPLLIFRLTGSGVDIVRILHQRMDFERHL